MGPVGKEEVEVEGEVKSSGSIMRKCAFYGVDFVVHSWAES
jgi:hypothetical protein